MAQKKGINSHLSIHVTEMHSKISGRLKNVAIDPYIMEKMLEGEDKKGTQFSN